MPLGPTILPPPPVRPPEVPPEVDDVVRSLIGDSYPNDIFVIYLPQRVSHAFFIGDLPDQPQNGGFHWMLAFREPEMAEQWANAASFVRRVGPMWQREPVEIHQHPLEEACELAKRLYPALLGLMILYRDGRQIRHWVR